MIQFNKLKKIFTLSLVWLTGIYVLLFVLCSYASFNEKRNIKNRADDLINLFLTNFNKSYFKNIPAIQKMRYISPPTILKPASLAKSLFMERQLNTETIEQLKSLVEIHKKKPGKRRFK